MSFSDDSEDDLENLWEEEEEEVEEVDVGVGVDRAPTARGRSGHGRSGPGLSGPGRSGPGRSGPAGRSGRGGGGGDDDASDEEFLREVKANAQTSADKSIRVKQQVLFPNFMAVDYETCLSDPIRFKGTVQVLRVHSRDPDGFMEALLFDGKKLRENADLTDAVFVDPVVRLKARRNKLKEHPTGLWVKGTYCQWGTEGCLCTDVDEIVDHSERQHYENVKGVFIRKVWVMRTPYVYMDFRLSSSAGKK